MTEAIVHVGTHKTGTTALQTWAEAHKTQLLDATGIRYYDGFFGPSHYEFGFLCLDPARGMPMRDRMPTWNSDELRDEMLNHITDQLRGDDDLLISSESLSYVRDARETDRVRALLAPRKVRFVVVFREPASFLRSYRHQMIRMGYDPAQAEPSSFAYTAEDSWLAKYDDLVSALGDTTIVDYEAALERYGSIIPAVFDQLGFPPDELPSWSGYRTNVTSPLRRLMNRFR